MKRSRTVKAEQHPADMPMTLPHHRIEKWKGLFPKILNVIIVCQEWQLFVRKVDVVEGRTNQGIDEAKNNTRQK